MPINKLSAILAIVVLCGAGACDVSTMADEAVVVRLFDGRVVTGSVDAKTNADHLWLRRSAERFDVVSGYRWDQVIEAQINDRTIDNAELRAWAADHGSPGRRLDQFARPIEVQSQPASSGAGPAPHGKIKTLMVDAELAGWDQDAQSDGLRIFVWPLDARGRLVPVAGHIEFTLAVEREFTNRTSSYVKGPAFAEAERLSFTVKPEHFASGPAFYELPFSRWHPDFEPTIAPDALLHARLSVPGQGVYEASDAQVCVRQLSRFRDQLQYYTPGRYLPLEHPSRDGR